MRRLQLLTIICASMMAATVMATAVTDDDNSVPASPLVSAKQPDNVYTDTSKTIMVTKDKPSFIIKLPANPTTGYSWFTKSYDDRLLNLEKQVYVAPKSSMTGQGGYTYWYFTATDKAFQGAFVSQIQLIYGRPWELNDPKADNRGAVFVVTTTSTASE